MGTGSASEELTDGAAHPHRRALVINGLGAARTLRDLVESMQAGGATAVNWTVAAPGGDVVCNDLLGVVRAIGRMVDARESFRLSPVRAQQDR